MLIKMLKKHFFNLCIDDMAAYDRIKLFCVKKYLLCTLARSRLVQTRPYRSSLSQMFFQIDVLKISQILQENTSVGVSPATLLKTGVFL